MKKFLTVLLVIAVMFTFSFSSAFAAASADEAAQTKVTTEQNNMAEAVNGYAAEIVYTQAGKLNSAPGVASPDANLTKAAVDTAIAKIIADYNLKIQAAATTAVADGTFDSTDATAVENAWKTDLGNDTKMGNAVFTSYATTLYDYAVTVAKDEALAKVNAVDETLYSKTDAVAVKALKDNAKAEIEGAAKDKDGLEAIVTAVATFESDTTGYKQYQTVAAAEEELAKAKSDAKVTVATKADAFKTARKAALEAIINGVGSDSTAIANANTELAMLDANVAAVVEMYGTKIDAAETTGDVTTATSDVDTIFDDSTPTNFNTLVSKLGSVDLLVKYAEAYGTELKNQYDRATGVAVYNAATVDAGVEAVVKKIKALDADFDTYGEIKGWMDNEANIPKAVTEKDALTKAINDGIALITKNNADVTLASSNADIAALKAEGKDYALTNWTGDNKDAVEAIQKEYTDKIKTAADAKEVVTLVKEARKAIDAYLTASQVNTLEGKVQTKAETLYDGSFDAYINGIAAQNSTARYTAETKAAAKAAAYQVMKDAAVATQDATLATNDKALTDLVKANYAAALAKIDASMVTEDALKAAKKEVEDAIAALPTTATLENKAAYLDAQALYEKFLEMPGTAATATATYVAIESSAVSLLDAYMTKVIRLEREAVEEQIKALPKTITAADKEAVKAAVAANDAYEEAYKDYSDAATTHKYSYVEATNKATLTTAQTNLTNALKTDAAKKIAALPATITAADKDAVKAARAAYDALDAVEKAEFDRDSEALVKKLLEAEEALKMDDSAAKAYVQDLSIKARSEKTSKGIKITVKADVQELLDAGYTVEYKFYRSTYSNKKFGTAKVTKTTNTYTNTNGVKGKKYYYKAKLVVKNAAGEVVATTPLTQCFYACRVF